MVRVSFEGIDRSGKTSVVNRLAEYGVPSLHLTNFDDSYSNVAHLTGQWLGKRADAAEERGARWTAYGIYAAQLGPYLLDWRAKKSQSLVASDREPIVSLGTHLELSVHESIYSKFWPGIEKVFNFTYGTPALIFHMQVSPETAKERISEHRQKHETPEDLEKLIDITNRRLHKLNGTVEVIPINNDSPRYLDDVMKEIVGHLVDRNLLSSLNT